ncbi:MAG: dihydrolipoyl dehydrogenase [Lachnospiraceae bacterium]|jgi:dihydrolipoamide dehydrogenase|nr:dihydrolipoyl dehydrogenase [Lachnospiraceae bacterium]
MKEFDVIVLGGGPGGYVAAIRAAKHGLNVALIEKDEVGGTCLNRGCIPTKAFLHSSNLYHEASKGAGVGINVSGLTYDFKKIAENKESVVKKLVGGVSGLLKANKVTLIKAKGVLKSGNEIEAGGETFHAKSIIIATGSIPATPPIPGSDLEGVMNSDGVLALKEAPASVVVVGGGVIGIEFATFFSQLGIDVTVLEFLPDILATLDKDAAKPVEKALKKSGVMIHTGVKVVKFEKSGKGLKTTYEDNGSEVSVESAIVIVATGRKPVTKEIGLEAAGVKVNERGFIETDLQMRTNVPGIYAIGDITGKIQLAHVASAQGIVAADVAAGLTAKIDYNAVPSCVYTTPEIAGVGLSESQAKDSGKKIKIGSFPVPANGRSIIHGATDGIAKLVIDETTGEILGAHLCAPNATEMIAGIVVAMNAEATVEELSSSIFPHPTVSEVIMEAAEDCEGMCIHKV